MPVFPFQFTPSGPMSPITTKPWSPTSIPSTNNLVHKENGFKDINGNVHELESTVNWDNGNVTKIVDVYFAVNKNKTIESVTSHIDIVGVNDTFSEAIL
ncbi:hypothetical protein [Xenorhabdus taiwanensis]|uniref:Uncharacterized protein n=1 Tax=Xenorhabdus taiwanensis TaxID=3085177 RepID=A0ABM8JZU7_9GAMM|nr:hypothetical protein TCT1_31460 [Xenorhabdus sp. TCT-1]